MDSIKLGDRILEVRYDGKPSDAPSALEQSGHPSLADWLSQAGKADRLHLDDPADPRFVILIHKANPADDASDWVVQLSRGARQGHDWGEMADPAHSILATAKTATEAWEALRGRAG
jgi:hypothetical protein